MRQTHLIIHACRTKGINPTESIYIKKKVCVFVRYALSLYDSYDHETFHDAPLGPMEGQRRAKTSTRGVAGGLGEISFTSSDTSVSINLL